MTGATIAQAPDGIVLWKKPLSGEDIDHEVYIVDGAIPGLPIEISNVGGDEILSRHSVLDDPINLYLEGLTRRQVKFQRYLPLPHMKLYHLARV